MPYSLEKLPDEPIVLYVQHPGGNPMLDMLNALADIGRMLDAQSEPVFMVYEIATISVGVDDLMKAANASARGSSAVLHHPNVRENVYVTRDAIVRMGIRGLVSASFGVVNVSLFSTLPEALAHCREDIGMGGS